MASPGRIADIKPDNPMLFTNVGASLLAMESEAPRLASQHASSLTTIVGAPPGASSHWGWMLCTVFVDDTDSLWERACSRLVLSFGAD
ncbi:hypothetical protein EMIT0P291_10019 [Pseudomonas sp. IT-P291]